MEGGGGCLSMIYELFISPPSPYIFDLVYLLVDELTIKLKQTTGILLRAYSI